MLNVESFGMLKGVVVWCFAALAFCAEAAQPAVLCLDSVSTASAAAHDPAGIWQVGADGAIFRIDAIPGKSGCYTLTLLDGADTTVATGTSFGSMEGTGSPRKYDAALRRTLKGSGASRTRNFIIELSADGTSLDFRHYSKGWVLNPLRLVPYLGRVGLRRNDSRPSDVDVAVRLAPVCIPSTITL